MTFFALCWFVSVPQLKPPEPRPMLDEMVTYATVSPHLYIYCHTYRCGISITLNINFSAYFHFRNNRVSAMAFSENDYYLCLVYS